MRSPIRHSMIGGGQRDFTVHFRIMVETEQFGTAHPMTICAFT